MGLPLVLIVFATASAAVVAYGTHPDLAQYTRGLAVIMVSRRLMWPMIAISLLLCVALLGLVISGKRRAWWLIGLAPVLALFVHRFAPGNSGPGAVVDGPVFVDASDPRCPAEGEYVVGLTFANNAYAFPYKSLFATPVVAVTDYDQRLLLIWSAYANRALAVTVSREIKARDLEVVSSPANSLLVYDRRLGRFILGMTGQYAGGGDVAGFGPRVSTEKVPWSVWKSRHADTKVMLPARTVFSAPSLPILPQYRLRVPPVPDPLTAVVLLGTERPAAVAQDARIDRPINATVGSTRVLVFRDRAGVIRAFDRHVRDDLFLTFSPTIHRRTPGAEAWVDSDTQSVWTTSGRAIEGPLKGERLREISVEDRLYWGVMKFWYPDLQLIEPSR
jgi:hypothetical protein